MAYDLPILILRVVPLFGTPIVVGILWWMWFRSNRKAHSRWRAAALLVAIVAVSANGVMFYSWVAYLTMVADEASNTSPIYSVLGSIADYLALTGLAGAIVGKGRGRTLIALGTIMGWLLWVPLVVF
jgi:hypothetical protein